MPAYTVIQLRPCVKSARIPSPFLVNLWPCDYGHAQTEYIPPLPVKSVRCTTSACPPDSDEEQQQPASSTTSLDLTAVAVPCPRPVFFLCCKSAHSSFNGRSAYSLAQPTRVCIITLLRLTYMRFPLQTANTHTLCGAGPPYCASLTKYLT